MPLHITHITTVVVPVRDEDRALAFYTGPLGLETVSDFTYATGERWLEVAPPGTTNGLTLAASERTVGVETGIVLSSDDLHADLEALRAAGVEVNGPLAEGQVRWWAGAPLAGRPAQALVRDPDGNSLLIVQGP